VPERTAQLRDSLGILAVGLVRVDPEGREDAVVSLRETERRPAGVESGADGDDAIDAGRAGAPDEPLRVLRAGVEVRVRVDHATAAAPASSSGSMRGKSGVAARTPVAASAVAGRTRSHDR